MFSAQTFAAILPEILILSVAMLILIVEPFWKEEKRRNVGWLTAAGLLASIAISLVYGRPGAPVSVLGGAVRFDWLGFYFKLLFMFAAAATALLLMDHETAGKRGEPYLLLLTSLLGLNLMAAASDLIMLYLAIETASIPLYVLAGFLTTDARSTEAGFKYLLFGTVTSTVMLYGFSLVFGFAGTTDIYQLAAMFAAQKLSLAMALGLVALILVGLGFKVTVVPFQFWAPDVYEGAPTPVAGFLSTASKAAGFAVLLRLFFVGFAAAPASPQLRAWTWTFAALAAVTMTLGNLLALPQTNLKRLLAYSSIAHAGYVLIGLVAFSQFGAASVVFYLTAYIATNLLAFGIVFAVSRATGSDEMKDYAGMSRRNPLLALMMLTAFLSLTGMPPFGGFVAKVVVFAAGVQSGYTWLVVLGILNSVVGVYYYLNAMKFVYLYRMAAEDEDKHPITMSRPFTLALIVLALAVIVIGTAFAPWFSWSNLGAANLF